MPGFGDESAKKTVTEAVKAAESHTAAELVISLHAHSGRYRDVDYLVGFALSLLTLTVLLILPQEFETDWFPLYLLGAFVIGTLLSHVVPPVRRLLVSKKRRREHVRAAARNAFFSLGVGRTTKRSGVLVFVSHFERMTELAADVGVDIAALGSAGETLRDALESAAARNDVAAFADAIRRLGEKLGEALPRSADDVDELPDAPDVEVP